MTGKDFLPGERVFYHPRYNGQPIPGTVVRGDKKTVSVRLDRPTFIDGKERVGLRCSAKMVVRWEDELGQA